VKVRPHSTPTGRDLGGDLVMTAAELAVIEARLGVSGLFAAYAHTDVTRLLAEVHRLHRLLAAASVTATATTGWAGLDGMAAGMPS
jgi:hypothetical protein